MTYKINLTQLKHITDDTPLHKRETPCKMKESIDFLDANSTYCDYSEERSPNSFQLRFKVKINPNQQAIQQNTEEKCEMGSSFGMNQSNQTKTDQIKFKSQKKQRVYIQQQFGVYTNHNVYKETLEQLKQKKVVKKQIKQQNKGQQIELKGSIIIIYLLIICSIIWQSLRIFF